MSSAKDYAFRLLGLRRMTEGEVRKKLLSRKYTAEEIDEAISVCIYYGYINDNDYAEAYVKDGYNIKKWGRKRIFSELKQKGVSTEIIEDALAACPILEETILLELVERKYANLSSMEQKERQKVFHALLRRGFSYNNIQKVMNTHDLTEEEYE